MAKLLGPNIDSVKKAYLANLARHEGFNVLKELGGCYEHPPTCSYKFIRR